MLKSLLMLLLRKKLIVLALRVYSKSTENKLDDYGVAFVEAALNADEQGMADAIEKLADEYLKTKK